MIGHRTICVAFFFLSSAMAGKAERHILFPHGKTDPALTDPSQTLVITEDFTSVAGFTIDDGQSNDESYTQHLKNVRRMLEATDSKPGRRSLKSYFRRTTKIYRSQGYDRIASALKKSFPVLLEIGSAESAADLNRPRARRATRNILRESLAFQSIVAPTQADPVVPLYTALAASYGAQLKTAFQNLRKDRRLTKGFGKTPNEMWLGTPINYLGGAFPVEPINLGSGYTYNVGASGTNSYGGSVTGNGANIDIDFSTLNALTFPYFRGFPIALPMDQPVPPGATLQIDPWRVTQSPNKILTLGTTRYDLTDVPTDPPHRIYGLPEGTVIPDGAIVLISIEEPEPTPTPAP